MRILRPTVEARNAFAHGAVIRLDKPTSDGIKRLLVETIQLLVGAGRHHMILEVAWYNWEDIHGFQDGHNLDNWQTGESAIRGIISDLGRIPQV
tara:strand:- start:245 stop:526 length:282 start_codon:yes stop_codon:yes gene_type:complete